MSFALMRTLKYAPSTAVLAHKTPTPASESELGIPSFTMVCIIFIELYAVSITCKGISVAYFVASSMASFLVSFSSVVPLGILKPKIILLKALVSSSTKNSNLFLKACPFSAYLEKCFHCSSQPAL